jgi:hypothetical protein
LISGSVSRVNETLADRLSDKLLSGWTIFIDTNRNGKLDPGEHSRTTQKAPLGFPGYFSFPKMRPGTYTICVIPRSGFKVKSPASITLKLSPGTFGTALFDVIKK